MTLPEPLLGARVVAGGVRFGLFTDAERCAVRLFGADDQPLEEVPLAPVGGGYFQGVVPNAGAGTLYRFVVGEQVLPDPYARWLPRGILGPAMVVEARRPWRSERIARAAHEHVIYELHVGTFTPEGTYRAAVERLPELAALGVTTLELMPLSTFAGTRGWGYDGVAHFAPHPAYGTPDELRELIDRAHELGLSILLDVVYNHFGPAGNYLSAYSQRYMTHDAPTSWGDAPNFAEPIMRRFALENARYWLEEFHFDGLRLDATHALFDPSPQHILAELVASVSDLAPKPFLVAEDERNTPFLVREAGLDAIWADDFHHQVHVSVTSERDGYYRAYDPGVAGLARAIEQRWLYTGQEYAPTGKPRGAPATGLPESAFVYCLQNHDQIGNRALGERLAALTTPERYRAMALLLLTLPMLPLLFMGDEWAASTPFLYFTDHEEELGKLVSAGRRREFEHFAAFADEAAREAIPDPQVASTFERSKLVWSEREEPGHAETLALFRAALALRRTDPVLRVPAQGRLHAEAAGDALLVRRWVETDTRLLVTNLGASPLALRDLAPYRALAEPHCLLASDGCPPFESVAPSASVLLAGTSRATPGGQDA